MNGTQKSANSTGATASTTAAPSILSATINQGAAQRSRVTRLDVVFSTAVTLDPGAIRIQLSTGAPIPNTILNIANPSGDQASYVLSFSGSAVIAGSLPDGISMTW